MNKENPRSLPYRLDQLVLVCKACGKRDSGPRDAKPKQVAQQFKRSAKEQGMKSRVLLTSCMGLCPKRSTAVALVGTAQPPRFFAIEALEQIAAITSSVSRDAESPAR